MHVSLVNEEFRDFSVSPPRSVSATTASFVPVICYGYCAVLFTTTTIESCSFSVFSFTVVLAL